jgi:hypothetical protein
MPNSTKVTHRGDSKGPFEELRFDLEIACPEEGEAITFYRRLLADAGYRLATSPAANWVYFQNFERGYNAQVYKAVFCGNNTQTILFIEVQCPVTEVSARGSTEEVSVVILRDRPYRELQRVYNVNCSE